MSTRKHSSEHLHAARERITVLRAARKAGGSAALVAEAAASRLAADSDTRRDEQELALTVWPEYGYLSPLERTEEFTRAYEKIYREKYQQYFDFHRGADSKPVDPVFVKNTRSDMTALWHARQHADRLGVRYSFFVRVAVEQAIEFWKNKRIPRPNQLWRSSMLLAIVRAWNVEGETRSYLPRKDWDRRFHASHFRGETPQMAALDLIERDVLRAGPNKAPMRLKLYLMDHLMITEQEARRRFGDELVDTCYRDSDELSVPGEALVGDPYLRPCLGLVDTQDAPGCVGCKLMAACAKAASLARKDLRERFGSEDPRLEKKRSDTRERVRRLRARRAEQESTLLPLAPVSLQPEHPL